MKKWFIYLVVSILLSGCVTIRKNELPPVQEYPTTRINKRISVSIKSECYTRGGTPTECSDYKDDLLNTMEESQLFRAVGVGEYYADYDINIKYVHDDNYSIFLTILTFVPTFGLIPKLRTDKFYITIDVKNKQTKEHKKTIITEDMLTINQIFLLFITPAKSPLQEFTELKQDILKNITLKTYELIQEFEQKKHTPL